MCISHVLYADNICLLASTASAMQCKTMSAGIVNFTKVPVSYLTEPPTLLAV